jgi:pimeloyl-[acyl-carrier protein] methyl ester esterase
VQRPMVVLLPGMDGTGKLFRGLIELIPADWPRRVISYPPQRVTTYEEVLELVEAELIDEKEIVLVAESYSGPVALRFAARHPQRVVAVVLCASFICSPAPAWLRWVVGGWIFWCRPPNFVLRQLLVGKDASDALLSELREAIAQVRPKVLARRLRDVMEVDCGDALRDCKAPMLYLAASRDGLIGGSAVAAIERSRPDVEIRAVDGPHLLLQSATKAAWCEIDAFLRKLK